jgi:hypothetical protein
MDIYMNLESRTDLSRAQLDQTSLVSGPRVIKSYGKLNVIWPYLTRLSSFSFFRMEMFYEEEDIWIKRYVAEGHKGTCSFCGILQETVEFGSGSCSIQWRERTGKDAHCTTVFVYRSATLG